MPSPPPGSNPPQRTRPRPLRQNHLEPPRNLQVSGTALPTRVSSHVCLSTPHRPRQTRGYRGFSVVHTCGQTPTCLQPARARPRGATVRTGACSPPPLSQSDLPRAAPRPTVPRTSLELAGPGPGHSSVLWGPPGASGAALDGGEGHAVSPCPRPKGFGEMREEATLPHGGLRFRGRGQTPEGCSYQSGPSVPERCASRRLTMPRRPRCPPAAQHPGAFLPRPRLCLPKTSPHCATSPSGRGRQSIRTALGPQSQGHTWCRARTGRGSPGGAAWWAGDAGQGCRARVPVPTQGPRQAAARGRVWESWAEAVMPS